MSPQAEQSIIAMMNCFPQTNQDYRLLLASLDRLCAGLTDQAIIEAAERYAAGDVKDQSKRFAPSGPEFVEEARRRQEMVDLRNRPRIAAPKAYRPGTLAPFELSQQRKWERHGHLPILAEDINFDQWKRLSAERQFPVGAVWVASLGVVFGPEPRHNKSVGVAPCS